MRFCFLLFSFGLPQKCGFVPVIGIVIAVDPRSAWHRKTAEHTHQHIQPRKNSHSYTRLLSGIPFPFTHRRSVLFSIHRKYTHNSRKNAHIYKNYHRKTITFVL